MIKVTKIQDSWALDCEVGATITCLQNGFICEEDNGNVLTVQYEPIPPGWNVEVFMTYKAQQLPYRQVTFVVQHMEMGKVINDNIESLMTTPSFLTLGNILCRNLTKGDLAKLLKFDERFKAYDSALPQNWLDDFAYYCKGRNRQLTYDLIRSTTFWVYPDKSLGGHACSCCFEVEKMIQNYHGA